MRSSWFRAGIPALLAVVLVAGSVFGGLASSTNQSSSFFKEIPYNKSAIEADDFLKEFKTVIIDPMAFKKAADSGVVSLELFGRGLKILLTPVKVQSENAVIIIENESGKFIEEAPPLYTYRGKVEGIKNSRVIFTVSGDVVVGMIELGDEYFVVDQTNKKYNGRVVHIIYSSEMVRDKTNATAIPLNDDVISHINLKTVDLMVENTLTETLSTTTVDLLAGYDTEFKNAFSNPTAEIASMIASVNDAYAPAGVQLSIKSYRYYSNIPNGDCGNVLGNFFDRASSDRDSTKSDLAFLFSGKNFNGQVVGCSYGYCGGSAWCGFATAQMVSEPGTSYTASFKDRCILIAHETGHNFDAGHQDNTDPNYARAYHWKYIIWDRYTALWTPFMGTGWIGGMQLEFSDRNNHGDSTHDNIRRISETKTTIAGYR